jgi:hypothetical protein
VRHVLRRQVALTDGMFCARILLELGVADDPVWTYFDSQHKYIMNQMNISYKSAVGSIRGAY